MLGILKIFILSTNGKDVKRAILENRSTLSEDFRLILRYIEIDGSNDRHKYKSTTSPTQYVLLDRAREGSLKKSYVRNMRKTSMTGDHPRQIRVIASSGAKLRAEEEELMPFEGAMLMPTRPERFR